MIVTLDTEFLDDGKTIELISIALVAEDGREFYGVNFHADWPRIWGEKWLRDNVLPHLPPAGMDQYGPWWPNHHHRDVMSRRNIAHQVERFLAETPEPELWADHPATDHVVGYQLFGSMIEASRDHGWPMRTNCLSQERMMQERRLARMLNTDRLRPGLLEDLPVQDPKTLHHALYDARHDMEVARVLGLVSPERSGA